MKKILTTIACLLLLIRVSIAQDRHFTTSGTIEFEKSSNLYAMFEREINKDNEAFLRPAFEQMKKTQPQFRVLKSTFTFNNNKTLYTPVATETPTNNNFNLTMAEQNNAVYTDLTSGTSIAQKKVFEETFLIKDTVRKIKWKITDETREVAGYTCRRANAIVMDSIYVVAFYTDKILPAGGPESFTGLPGMILEVAIPHENVIWRATKVTDMMVPETTIVPPKKGKATTNKSFRATLDGAMKSWGNYAQSALKSFQL
jgi:GLPGLI family protein